MIQHTKHIVIADPDHEYIKSFEEKLIKSFYYEASIQIITSREYLENYFRLHRDIDVLLISRKFYGEFLKEHNISHIMLIDRKINMDPDSEDSGRMVLKYRTKEEIFEFIKNSLAGISEDDDGFEDFDIPEETQEKKTRVITVYSPIGGSGKSLAAIALAKKLKKLGESAIVIGCDNLQSFCGLLETRQTADPALALHIRDINENTYWSLLKNVYQGEITCLLPFEKPLSKLGIKSAQIYDIVELIKEKNDFSHIILDVGTALNKETISMIALSDVCVVITEPKLSSCRMMEKLLLNIDLLSVEKMYIISNHYRTEGINLDATDVFGSFSGYDTAEEAMEDPVFYRLALELV